MHIIVSDRLAQAGLDLLAATEGITYHAPGQMSKDELIAAGANATGLIIRSATTVDAEVFAALPRLKAIARAGVGVDNIDRNLATERGVVVMNAPDGNTIATAELTLGLLLGLARHIPQAHMSLTQGNWEKSAFMGTELRGKNLGIIGFGRVGQAVAKRAQAFEMRVLAYDPFIPQALAQEQNVALLPLDEVLAQADFLTLHTVATADTKGIINAANLARMKDGVRIINAARGNLINEDDLAAALESGKVAGAALDVFSSEPPPPGHPLIGNPNLITTPHLGASTAEAQDEVALQAVQNLLDGLLKGEYRNVMNPDVLQNH